MFDVIFGIVLILLGALAAAFPSRFRRYLDSTAGQLAKDQADRGFRWSLEVYPVQRRLLLWLMPPLLVLIGAAFVIQGWVGPL